MSYAIVYSSRTGNTAQLAQALREALPQEKCSYFGQPHAEALSGFGGAPAYFDQILGRVKENLAPGVQVVGSYMCQGKMPQVVRDRYEAMEDSPRRTAMLENFDRALSHPDQQDLLALKKAVEPTL